jgi:phage head maturation protease
MATGWQLDGNWMATGWQLDGNLNSPVFLWAHDYSRPVIDRASEVCHEPHRLIVRMKFAPTDFAQEVAVLYRPGFQKGVSVGFKPLRYEERRR